MPLTLTLRETPQAPLEAETLSPDALAGAPARAAAAAEVWHGNERASVGDFFAVSGTGDGELRVVGDLRRVKFVGAGMASGRLIVEGDVGMHTGAGMRGGQLRVEGDSGDWTGAEMRGGRLLVAGSAGRALGGAYPGSAAGMRGGEIVLHGDAGDGLGGRLRRGLIAVGGDAGADAGFAMLAGTIVVLGGLGASPGAELAGGRIVTMRRPGLLPTYAFTAMARPRRLRRTLAGLREIGLAVSDEQLCATYERWTGDRLVPGDGEILVPRDAP